MLKYIGNGKHITGIPARDLTDKDITEFYKNLRIQEIFHLDKQAFIDLLIERGVYEAPPLSKKNTKKQDKDSEV